MRVKIHKFEEAECICILKEDCVHVGEISTLKEVGEVDVDVLPRHTIKEYEDMIAQNTVTATCSRCGQDW